MRKITALILIFINTVAFSQLKINELMTNNVSAHLDKSYNYSMWVEVFNKSATTSYNQIYYHFTDDMSVPKKWKPASKTIAAGGYSIIYFERPTIAEHASFKLNPEGGMLYLTNNAGVAVDSVKYPSQKRNCSYGRLSDGEDGWVFYEQFSPGATNNGKHWAIDRCTKPIFTLAGGIYSTAQTTSFESTLPEDTIYYTLNGAEPTQLNAIRYIPGSKIELTKTTILRAKTFCYSKLSSDINTSTYLIGERTFNLPIVSIVTDQRYLTDNTLGIYVEGTNGIIGNGMKTPVNWNQDWDRPVNFELIDTTNTIQLNQELDVSIAGGWSRKNKQKSLKISPRKKFGNDRLYYDFFKATKPGNKYKDIMLRNSGNDFYYSMMRDAVMQSTVMKRMNLDYTAYEPAVCFMNGIYFGIQNLRERSSEDYIYSNYGYDESEIMLAESSEMSTNANFKALTDYITKNDITSSTTYNKVAEMMDIDNFASYMISEIYFGNYDWPDNNTKIWKKIEGGKWRWILYDTDFGFNLYKSELHNYNSLCYALGEDTTNIPAEWSTVLLRNLIKNPTFRNKIIDKFCIELSTTFKSNRVNAIMDSIASKISSEIAFHKAKWGSYRTFNDDILNMKKFSYYRPDNMLKFISDRLLDSVPTHTIHLNATIPGATYTMNGELIMDSKASIKSYKTRELNFKALPTNGYKFKNWEVIKNLMPAEIIPFGGTWKYFDGSSEPAIDWKATTYIDSNWKTGQAQLGYGNKGEVTTIGYGGVASNKYTTAYFRKTFMIEKIATKYNFVITATVDDGAAIYVNGTEIGRFNLPEGTLKFSTLALTYNNGVTNSFPIPLELLNEGTNTIAVEVHQNAINSSDLMFNLSLKCDSGTTCENIATPTLNTTLTNDMIIKAVYEAVPMESCDEKIVINEIVSSNNLIADEYYEKDDYIELYNKSSQNINIAGWYISDTPGNKMFHKISTSNAAETTIPANGRIILWADAQTTQGNLHLGFKLGKEGETITLSRVDTANNIITVDTVSYPAMLQNMSYSRLPDGAQYKAVKAPTFNKTNSDENAIEYLNNNTITVFPTLANENITIKNAENCNIVVTDITGKILQIKTSTSNQTVIEMSHLNSGLYIVKVNELNFKIVKR